jgi:protoporphyrinogen oxidase
MAEPTGDPASTSNPRGSDVVIVGAGPAGLTAAYCLAKRGATSTVLEADDVVGGISRTVERDGWRFDIGGHRFFTKVKVVDDLWHEILPAEDFLLRPRMSRIYYRGTFFDYPLKAMNALRGLGLWESFLCVMSYIWVRIKKPKDMSTFEGWTASRFGWRLYRIFFKTYTEKVWGVPAKAIQADWAAQRIKNLSLFTAILNALMPKRNQKEITSLIEEFQYPKYGPGQMWEVCRGKVEAAGTKVLLETTVVQIHHADGRVHAVTAETGGVTTRYPVSDLVSSMPINSLLEAMDPKPPREVLAAAHGLKHRDFLTVALVVPERFAFPDNWIYVHAPEVRVGRVQNFGSWSPYLVKEGRTCLGLEYFVNVGDDLWEMDDDDLVRLASRELATIDLVTDPSLVEAGYVVRMPKAYPVYDATYRDNVDVLREWLAHHAANVYPVGRNGMHKYNNQDHSMYTAMLSVENILDDAGHDVWIVNVEQEYHEEGDTVEGGRSESGTGRAAPIVPAS